MKQIIAQGAGKDKPDCQLYNGNGECYSSKMASPNKEPERTILRHIPLFCLSACLLLCITSGFAHGQEPAGNLPAAVMPPATASNSDSQKPELDDQAKPGFFPWVWQMLTDEANVTAGVGVLQLSLKVKRHVDGAEATMVQRDRSTLFLSYSTRPSFFKDSNFGYTVMIGYTDFDMTQQKTDTTRLSISAPRWKET